MALASDVRRPLHWLKLGAIVNVALLVAISRLPAPDLSVVVPAWILLSVSAFRCVFPNRYLDNIVLHDTLLKRHAVIVLRGEAVRDVRGE